jgi:hypothetical protein
MSFGGIPVARAKVRVGDLVTTTDERGRFTVANALPQYDAVVVCEHDPAVFVFPNLVESNPALWLYELASSPRLNYRATVHVAAPMEANTATLYFAEINAPSDDGFSIDQVHGTDGTDLILTWSGAPSAGISIHALRYEADPKTKYVTRYTGLVSREMQVEDHRVSTWLIDRLAFEPIGTKMIATELDVSASMSLEDSTFGMQPFGSSALTVLPVPRPSTHETLEFVPDLPDATFVLAALGTPLGSLSSSYAMSRVSHGSRDSSKMSLRLSRALRVLSPNQKATGVTPSTDFTWEPSSEALTHVVIFTPALLSPVVAPDVYVQTREASAKLPDASALGVPWPSHAGYTWKVVTASWMPDPGNGKPRPSAYDDDHVSVSETREFAIE